MGILNVTPDSFSDGGQFADIELATSHALKMEADGADIIDIGGESTKPGSASISTEEELSRVIPLIKRLSSQLSIPISIDTWKSKVAFEAIQNGAELINDVSAFRRDPNMAFVAMSTNVPICLMHSRGTPCDMQNSPDYIDLIAEVKSELQQAIDIALSAGISREHIILDPGFGFAKSTEHNLELLQRLSELCALGYPILSGTSRKSMIAKTLGTQNMPDRIWGTASTVTASILAGARIIRVHDVKEMAYVAKMTDAIKNAGPL